MQELKPGLLEAVEEIKGWRELTIKAFRECPTTEPEDAQRNCQNQLNLLDVIISKLRTKAGESSKDIFNDMRTWEKVGYPEYREHA